MPPMFINVGAYVGDNTMIDSHALVGSCAQVGRNCHISAASQIGGVLEPVGALPVIMTGFKLGIGIGLVLIAVAEMVGAKSGLGYLIWSAWSTFAVEQMYVGLFVIAIIGFLISLSLNELERVIIPWKAE